MAKLLSELLGDINTSYFAEKNLENLTRIKIPIFILIDISESMEIYNDLLIDTLNKILSLLSKDRTTQETADIYILTYNDSVNTLYDGVLVNDIIVSSLHFYGCSRLGFALKTMMDKIDDIVNAYSNSTPRIKSYSPLLLILSDGNISSFHNGVTDNDLFNLTVNKIKDIVESKHYRFNPNKTIIGRSFEESGRLNVFSFAIGNECNYNNLRDLTGFPDFSHVLFVNNNPKWLDEFSDFFVMSD